MEDKAKFEQICKLINSLFELKYQSIDAEFKKPFEGVDIDQDESDYSDCVYFLVSEIFQSLMFHISKEGPNCQKYS